MDPEHPDSDTNEALPDWFHELPQQTKDDILKIAVPGLSAYRASPDADTRLYQERKLIADIKANSDLDATRTERLVNALVVNEQHAQTPGGPESVPVGPMDREVSDARSHTIRSQGFQELIKTGPPTSKMLTSPIPLDSPKSPPVARTDRGEVSLLTSTPQHLLARNATLRLNDTFFELIFDKGGILPNRKARRRANCKMWMCGSVKEQDGKITLTPKKCSVVMHGVEQGLERTFAGNLGGLGPALHGNLGGSGLHGNLATDSDHLPQSPPFNPRSSRGTAESNVSTMTLTAHWFAAEGFFLNSSEDENQKWLSEILQALPPDALDVLWKFLPESTFKREEVQEATFTLAPLKNNSHPGFEISGVDLQAITASSYDAANATLKFSSYLNAQPFFNTSLANKTELIDKLVSAPSNAPSGTVDTLPDLRNPTSSTTSAGMPSLSGIRPPDDFGSSFSTSLGRIPLSSRRHLSQMENSSPEPMLLASQTEFISSRRSKKRTKTHRSLSEGVWTGPRSGPTLQTIPSEESLKAARPAAVCSGPAHLRVSYGDKCQPRRNSQPARTSSIIVPQLLTADSNPHGSLVLPADPNPVEPKEIRVIAPRDSSGEPSVSELELLKEEKKRIKNSRPLTAQSTSSPRAIPSSFSALAANAPPWFNQFPYELQDKCMDFIGDLQANRREAASVVAELEKLGIEREKGTELIQHVCLPPRLLCVQSDIGVQRKGVHFESKDRPETCRGSAGPLKSNVSLSRPLPNTGELASQWTEDTDEQEESAPLKLENLESSPRHVYHWASTNLQNNSSLQVPKREDSMPPQSMGFYERQFDPHAHTVEEIISKFEERVVEDILKSLSSDQNQCRIASEELSFTLPTTIGEQAQLHIEQERNRRKLKRREERIKRMVMHLRHEPHPSSLPFESSPSQMSAMSDHTKRPQITSGNVSLQVPNILAMPSFSDTEGGSVSPLDQGSDVGLEAPQIDNRLTSPDQDTNSSAFTRQNVLQHTSNQPGPSMLSRLARPSQRFNGDDVT